MFKLSFFGRLAPQRRALLAARDIAPIPLLLEVAKHLAELGDGAGAEDAPPKSGGALLLDCALQMRGIIVRSALWRTAGAGVVVGAVLLSGRVVAPDSSLEGALLFAGLFLAAKIMEAAIEYFDALRRSQLNRALQSLLIARINRKLLHIDPMAALTFSKGELKTLVSSDVDAVEDFVSVAIGQWVPALVMLVVLGPALVMVAGVSGLLALGAAVGVVPLAFLGARFIVTFQLRAQERQDRLTTLVGEWVRNVRLVRYLGWQRSITKRLESEWRGFSLLYAGRHTIACIVYGLTWSWWMVPVLTMLGWAHLRGDAISLIQLFSSVWLLDQLMHYLQHVPYSLSLYGAATGSAARIRDLLAAPTITRHHTAAPQSGVALGVASAIHLREVELAINGTRVLGPISLSLDLKARTAILGSVGSGKSLLLEILIGERAPTAGSIEVEFDSGARASLWRRDVYDLLRSQVAYSAQQPFISNTRLRHNVDLGAESPLPAVERAAEDALLSADVALFRRGFEEEVGEVGINLSGGQKQRVSLARAFFSNRPIFVLDDPLSAVDSATERALMRNILSRARGVVLVSHRLRELLVCDRVVVMEQGAIVEEGVPRVLARQEGSSFRRFLEAVAHHGE